MPGAAHNLGMPMKSPILPSIACLHVSLIFATKSQISKPCRWAPQEIRHWSSQNAYFQWGKLKWQTCRVRRHLKIYLGMRCIEDKKGEKMPRVPSGGVVANVDREGCARPRRKAALSSVQLQVNPGRAISNRTKLQRPTAVVLQ